MKKRTIGKVWSELLWQIMSNTGHGYKRPSTRNTGKGDDRRKDKLEMPNTMARRYARRFGA